MDDMGVTTIRFPETSSIGIKPISEEGTKRLVRAAIKYALAHGRKSVTLVHKGNIMKYTEGGFRDWGYEVAKQEFGATEIDGGPWCRLPAGLVVKDVIADAFLQQILTRPAEYDVIATMNLNGDYISDALAAQVGGIGIAPGANINYITGHAIFEATHGTAPKYANQDKVNPGSVILSGEMMLRYMGWHEAADLIIKGLEKTIAQKRVTYDFERLMEGATLLSLQRIRQTHRENIGLDSISFGFASSRSAKSTRSASSATSCRRASSSSSTSALIRSPDSMHFRVPAAHQPPIGIAELAGADQDAIVEIPDPQPAQRAGHQDSRS